MNALLDPFKSLWQRKLWPVAVLLVGALVAVPMVLANEPISATPPANAQAKAEDDLPATFVTAAEPAEDGERRRVLGDPKDPFAPAPLSAKGFSKLPWEYLLPKISGTGFKRTHG